MVLKVFDTLPTSTLAKFRLCEFYTIIQYSCFFISHETMKLLFWIENLSRETILQRRTQISRA